MRSLAFIIISALCVLTAQADAAECTDKPECWPEGSAMHTSGMHRRSELSLSKQLDKQHEKLISLISTTTTIRNNVYLADERLVEAVKDQQKLWESFLRSECELIGALSGGADQWKTAKAIECEENLTRQRLKRMRHAVRCVERIPSEERLHAQKECIFQLAPMAVPLER